MSIELEQRLRLLERRVDELLRQAAAAVSPANPLQADAEKPDTKARRRDAAGRFI